MEVPGQNAPAIHACEPLGDNVGVMLVGRTSLPWVTLSEDGRIDLGDHRPSIGNTPPVKRPEMNPISDLLLNSSQPGESSVSGAGNLPLNVEVEDRLGRRGPPVGETKLIVGSCSRVALPQIKDAIAIVIGGPVLAEVGQEFIPIGEVVPLEVSSGEGEGVVDPGDEAFARSNLLEEPLGHLLATPVPVLSLRC